LPPEFNGIERLIGELTQRSPPLKGTAARPLFVIGRTFNGEAATAGNGQMVALLAPDRAAVDACHRRAFAAGGRDDGPPGPRPHYHPHYYGAYFRDTEGNKLCVVCHAAPG